MKAFKRDQQKLPGRRRMVRNEELEGSDTFRRGRTLTGSISSLVRTPSESQADLKSSRVHLHALVKQRRRLAGMLAVVAMVTALLYAMVSQFTAQPVVQASPDPSLRLDAVYAEAIDEYLADHMGERWRLFTNTDRLADYLQSSVPEVKSVRLRGSAGFGKSLFELTFREPIASWDINGMQLYVDASGVPFSRNYYGSPSLHIADQSGMASTSGQTVMSNRFMSFIGQVIGLSREEGYTVTRIVIPEGMTRQVEVHLKEASYPFKLSADRPAGEGVEDMVRVFSWMQERQLTPEYVDVRVEGRAFYR